MNRFLLNLQIKIANNFVDAVAFFQPGNGKRCTFVTDGFYSILLYWVIRLGVGNWKETNEFNGCSSNASQCEEHKLYKVCNQRALINKYYSLVFNRQRDHQLEFL